MNAQILDGKKLAAEIRLNLKHKIALLPTRPSLAVILIGNNPASEIYVRSKQKAAAEIGIISQTFRFNEDVSENKVLDLIEKLNNDSAINGILIQLPIPSHLGESRLIEAVNPAKDVDGFHPYNLGLLQNNSAKGFVAATPKGIMRLLDSTSIQLSGLNAVVIGRSKIVGKPAALLLLNQNCTVTIAHSKTTNLPELVRQADIVVAACGCPQLVRGSWIKPGAVVVDVGINQIDGHLYGDVEFLAAVERASYITPVPGGVGPMTIAMLLENTYEAYLKQNQL